MSITTVEDERTIAPLSYPKAMKHNTNGAIYYFTEAGSTGLGLDLNGVDMPLTINNDAGFSDYYGVVTIDQSKILA